MAPKGAQLVSASKARREEGHERCENLQLVADDLRKTHCLSKGSRSPQGSGARRLHNTGLSADATHLFGSPCAVVSATDTIMKEAGRAQERKVKAPSYD